AARALEADTVVANHSPIWQTNGTVWALAYAHGVVYASGDFTSVRPPGAAAGTGEVARDHLAAFDASSGELLPFNHSLNAKAWAMVPSADGSTLYIGGDFSTIDGASRVKLAAFDTATGKLTSWAPKVSGSVRGMAIHGDTVYFSGSFSTVFASGASGARKNLAAVTTADTLLPWAPTADLTVFRVAVAPDGGKVFVGGYFTNLNGIAMRGTGALDPNTGATLPWASANVLPPHTSTCTSDIRDIRVDASNVYFAAEGTGGGCFDGTFAARQSDGALVWKNNCLGATQSIEVIGRWLYKGSHAHDCSSSGGFPEVGTGGARHLLVEKLSDGSLGPWYPNTTGNPLGPRAFATDGTQLFVGGDFTKVNNKAQQGLTRFGGPPDLTRPRTPKVPTASSTTAGQVRLSWQATTDDDDETLVYRVYRDGAATPVYTSPPTRSTFWILPTLTFTDTGLTGGSTHSYRVDAKEANGTNVSPRSPAVTVAVAGADASYSATVRGDSPYLYWRVGESSGTTAMDSSGNGRTGLYQGAIALGQPGAIIGDSNTAVRFGGAPGNDGYLTTQSTTPVVNPQTFSLELWFRTTTTNGGKLIGFGNARTGLSSQFDRHVYMTNDGRLVFGVWVGGPITLQTTASYNDSRYHQVVATLSSAGMRLYVDGKLIGSGANSVAQAYNGFWRVSGDNLGNWPSRPTNNFWKGLIDEVSIYPTALSAEQVSEHFTRGHG
ncbi:MAG TPA: LamG-like jellyroll fold domain-containing protein, partial [Actinomycetota bacterium]|nr:LamG-like jellyroll fold domain-containing protein [Actinomycetota bacterium]